MVQRSVAGRWGWDGWGVAERGGARWGWGGVGLGVGGLRGRVGRGRVGVVGLGRSGAVGLGQQGRGGAGRAGRVEDVGLRWSGVVGLELDNNRKGV